MAHSALHNLPDIILRQLGEPSLPEEPRADCGACPMACTAEALPENPRRFHEDARCCTYHPTLPNWLVGQILTAGGQGADLVRARMADRGGVSAAGIQSSAEHISLRESLGEDGFGRALAVRCPYWVGGELACGIWDHRDAVCRSWFCRHADGPRSVTVWLQLKSLINYLNVHLSEQCTAQGSAPPDDASSAELEDWYRQCAEMVAEMSELELEEDFPSIVENLSRLLEALNQPPPPLLGAAIREMHPVAGGMEMQGYSRWDPVVVPMSIFRVLGHLTGEMTWQEALEQANAELPEPISAALIEEMYRRGALRALSGPEDLAVGGRVRIREGTMARPLWMDEMQELVKKSL